MPFQKKVKATDPSQDGAGATPVTGNESVNTEKKEKKNVSAATDIELQKKLYKKDQELEDLRAELEEARKVKASVKVTEPTPNVIDQLQAQINQLSSQLLQGVRGQKTLYRTATAADIAKESITFTARAVHYIVASYTDSLGLEKIPPFKLINFQYAASDIRKDGKEEEIKSFSQYSTNLQPEIDFLRGHPYYGVTFSENTNEMMNEDTKETQFKLQAANQLSAMAPEEVYARAKEYNIPDYMMQSASTLKFAIIAEMSKVYKKEAEALANDILRRRALATMIDNKE
jgi:hypothetical protein